MISYVDSLGRVRSKCDPAERFWSKVDKTDGPCWRWLGYVDTATGYGRFSQEGRMCGAHRVGYELVIGPIPAGLVLDHLCRNRACVNPAHLQPVTHATNILRGTGFSARHAAVTECPKGHAYDVVNTGRRPNGSRYCRTCGRDRARALRSEP